MSDTLLAMTVGELKTEFLHLKAETTREISLLHAEIRELKAKKGLAFMRPSEGRTQTHSPT
jgi:hypothetical protein